MKNIKAFLCLALCLGLSQALNVSESLEDYIRLNQRQNDAKLKQYEDEMANFRSTFAKQLEPIDVQADQLELKLEQTDAQLRPLELIDSWHRQCVLNYSSSIPTIASIRSSLTSCVSAESNLDSLLTSTKNTYLDLRSYYTKLDKSLADCAKTFANSQLNYTLCVTSLISNSNVYTVSNQKKFSDYLHTAQCSANNRIIAAWQCSFNQVYKTASTLGTVTRLIDDCINNETSCGSLATCESSSARGCDLLYLSDKERGRNASTQNPLYNLNLTSNCVEVHFISK